MDDIPIERFVGPGVIIDMPRDDWGFISGDDLEAARPQIEPGDIVVLHTGWHRHYDTDEERYILRSPGLTKTGVDWLVDRDINMVCFDGPSSEHIFMRVAQWRKLRPDVFGEISVDPAEFPPAYGHKAMFGSDIYHVDNVGGDIEDVLGVRCTIAALPAKYADVEAAPVRIVAMID